MLVLVRPEEKKLSDITTLAILAVSSRFDPQYLLVQLVPGGRRWSSEVAVWSSEVAVDP